MSNFMPSIAPDSPLSHDQLLALRYHIANNFSFSRPPIGQSLPSSKTYNSMFYPINAGGVI